MNLDPSDPFSFDRMSPDSPYFPYGGDATISAAIWWLEVIRQVQEGGGPEWLDPEDMFYMIRHFGDGFRDVIEYDLKQWKEQFADEAADLKREVDELMAKHKRDIDLYGTGRN